MSSSEEPAKGKQKKGEKLQTIMDAASALTSLVGEDESGEEPGSPHSTEAASKADGQGDDKEEPSSHVEDVKSPSKRYIPEHKKPDAALTFPEKLMQMMRFVDKQPKGFCIHWTSDGKAFVITDNKELMRKVVPQFFKATKYESFVRKLYRWGFRQVNRGVGPEEPVIFGNEYFQRDNAELMAKMRSTTAASTRKMKSLEAGAYGHEQNKLLLDRLYQEKSMGANLMPAPTLQGMYYSPPAGMRPPSMMSGQFPMLQNRMPGGYTAQPPMMSSPQRQNTGFSGMYLPPPDMQQQGPSNATEIVNAAINALRNAP